MCCTTLWVLELRGFIYPSPENVKAKGKGVDGGSGFGKH